MKTKALVVSGLLSIITGICVPADAQGFATWLGDRLGVGNVGRVIDNANNSAKKAVPIYGQTEEAVVGAGRHVISQVTVETTAPLLKNLILASRQDAINAGVSPLPQEVMAEFSGFYAPDVLSVVWRVGQGNELSLQANSFRFGDRAAISLDTVLVFRSVSEIYSVWLWAHELAHIEQYRRWGVDEFAKQYIRDWDAVEAEANRRADQFMQWRNSRQIVYTPPSNMPQPYGNMCVTQAGNCQVIGPAGLPCTCSGPWGIFPGLVR